MRKTVCLPFLVLTLFLLLLPSSFALQDQQNLSTERIGPNQIQPSPAELIDDEAYLEVLGKLRTSPRVHIEKIGQSLQGRPIFLIIVARAEVIERLDLYRGRAQEITAPAVSFERLGKRSIREKDLAELLSNTPLPVLFAGASWGHEAAQVEGLLQAVEKLAFEESKEVAEALSNAIGLFVPLMNPDGRAAALREWSQTPLSRGNSGVGNGYGFLINRDFIHATQPESEAIIRVTTQWRPVAGIDQHEDMYHLGVAFPQVAFVEPFEPGFDVAEHPLTRAAITSLGRAIAERWRKDGFNVLYNSEGDATFAPLTVPGKGISPVAGSAGRLNFMWSLHGISGFITESARSPGTQTWEDRVKQKMSSPIATLLEVSRHPSKYAGAVYQRKLQTLQSSPAEFVAIPLPNQPKSALKEILRTLELHQIRVFRVEHPYASLVVPLGQPEGEIARHLLLGPRSKLNLLPGALGLNVRSSESIPESQRREFLQTSLLPAEILIETAPEQSSGAFTVRQSVAATRLVNNLLQSSAGSVWKSDKGYLIEASANRISWRAALQGVDLEQGPAIVPNTQALRTVRIGIYSGQGIPHSEWGEIAWVLNQGGFPFQLVDESSVEERLASIDVLIVPNGSAIEIVNGWNREDPETHWQLPAQPAGIGSAGLQAIRAFVERGGNYIGIGAGGALLAGAKYLNLSSVEMPPFRIGLGIVKLTPAKPQSRLLSGFSDAPFLAFLDAPPGSAPAEGFAFNRAGQAAVAIYSGVETVPSEQSFLSTDELRPGRGHAAIVSHEFGKGQVSLFGISPTFRGQWSSTFSLLFNAIYPGEN